MPKDLGLEKANLTETPKCGVHEPNKKTRTGERASGVLTNVLIFFLLEGGIRSKQI